MKRFLLFFLIFIYCSAFSKQIKVCNTNDIKKVLKNISPGDVIIMQNGVWKDAAIVFSANGEKNKYIILKAEVPGKVVLTGSSTVVIKGSNLIVEGLLFKGGIINSGAVISFQEKSSFCELTNCAIIDYNSSNYKSNTKWIIINGSYNRVDHCFFRNKTNEGPEINITANKQPGYHLIDSNYFAYRPKLNGNGAEIIRLGFGEPTALLNSSTIVEHNYFEECNGEKEIISNKCSNNIFRFNTFSKCQGTISLRQGKNCIVEGNYFLGYNIDNTGGIKISNQSDIIVNNYFSGLNGKNFFAAISLLNGNTSDTLKSSLHPLVQNIFIINNTFINNSYNIVIGLSNENDTSSFTPVNVQFINNIFYLSKRPFVNELKAGKNFKWVNNIFYGSETGIDKSYNSNIIADPKFEKTDSSIMIISKSSPAAGKALKNILAQTTQIKSINTLEDIGSNLLSAKEHLQPLQPKNVGVSWVLQ